MGKRLDSQERRRWAMSSACSNCDRIVRCRDCKFCDVVPDGSTAFCRNLYDKPDWGLPAPYAGSEPAEMLEVCLDDFCAWGEKRQP